LLPAFFATGIPADFDCYGVGRKYVPIALTCMKPLRFIARRKTLVRRPQITLHPLGQSKELRIIRVSFASQIGNLHSAFRQRAGDGTEPDHSENIIQTIRCFGKCEITRAGEPIQAARHFRYKKGGSEYEIALTQEIIAERFRLRGVSFRLSHPFESDRGINHDGHLWPVA
jgi:hypothetical protein